MLKRLLMSAQIVLLPWDDIASEVVDILPDDFLTEMPQYAKRIDDAIESNIEEIEKNIRNVYYQI